MWNRQTRLTNQAKGAKMDGTISIGKRKGRHAITSKSSTKGKERLNNDGRQLLRKKGDRVDQVRLNRIRKMKGKVGKERKAGRNGKAGKKGSVEIKRKR